MDPSKIHDPAEGFVPSPTSIVRQKSIFAIGLKYYLL